MKAAMSPRVCLIASAAGLSLLLLGCAAGGTGSNAGSTSDAGAGAESVDEAGFGDGGPLRAQTRADSDLEESERLAEAARNLQPVFFAFDKFELDADARAALASNARWLRANSDIQVWIEGHCDERGTSEYNLALGEKRSRAVRSYLVQSGIDGADLRTISYGEERPFALGHDESAWRLNRRAHFRPTLR
jgi:peptidoglycan-associated lipoprotein